jgi:hypothetical protein
MPLPIASIAKVRREEKRREGRETLPMSDVLCYAVLRGAVLRCGALYFLI